MLHDHHGEGFVDILMPYYGDVAMMQAAVRSVLNQNDPRWRLTVVDDGAEPGVPEWFARLIAARGDDKIRYLRNARNLGITGNFQRCLSLVEQDLVTMIGSDDRMLPNYVATVLELFRRHPEASLAQPGVEVIDQTGAVVEPWVDKVKRRVYAPRVRGSRVLGGEQLAVSLLRGNWMYFPSICWRAEAITSVGFDEKLTVIQDLALTLEWVRSGALLAVGDTVCFQYRRHSVSVSSAQAFSGERFEEEGQFFDDEAERMAALGWRQRPGRRGVTSPRACTPRRCCRVPCSAGTSTEPGRWPATPWAIPRTTARTAHRTAGPGHDGPLARSALRGRSRRRRAGRDAAGRALPGDRGRPVGPGRPGERPGGGAVPPGRRRTRVIVIAAIVWALLQGSARESPALELTQRLVCAALAGLSTGALAGGVIVALHGTPYGLNGLGGDVGQLSIWAQDVLNGRGLPVTYPPLPAYALAGLSKLTGQPVGYAIKSFQIVGVAAVGPLAYLAWRLVLTPVWALVIGVTAALPLIDPYKTYPNTVLIVLVPVLVKAVLCLRTAARRGYWWAVLVGLVLGLGLGVLFEYYFGWFLWSGPGLVAAIALLFPWRERSAWLRAAVLVVIACGAFFAVAHWSLVRPADPGHRNQGHVLLFRHDGPPHLLQPLVRRPRPAEPGRLAAAWRAGGVDMFTVLLFVGLAVALMLGHRRADVVLISLLVASTWLIRFYLAERMFSTQTVQLYPRTNVQILYGLLLATGLALMLAVRSAGRVWPAIRLRYRTGAIAGVLGGVLLLHASMVDATANSIMPKNDTGNGQLAYRAHTSYLINGRVQGVHEASQAGTRARRCRCRTRCRCGPSPRRPEPGPVASGYSGGGDPRCRQGPLGGRAGRRPVERAPGRGPNIIGGAAGAVFAGQ